MSKKKPTRLGSHLMMDSQTSAKRRKFYASGAPIFISQLILFVIASSLILTCNWQNLSGIRHGQWPAIRFLLQIASLMVVFSAAMGLYIAVYQIRIVQNHLRSAVLLVTLLIMLAAIRLTVNYELSPYLMVVPVMLMAITMTIAYSQRFALGITSFLALVAIVGMQEKHELFQQGFAVLLTTGSGMYISVLLLKEIRTRTKLIEVCGLAGLVVFAMVWLTGWWQGMATWAILRHSAWAFAGAVSIGFVLQGLLPIIERVFRTATNLTLLDYGEADQPLLERLAIEAPGTFNHSWQVGMLSEAAAKAIGANGLLCRVGSYYHDIGKLNKPHYFIENQGEQLSFHKELAPSISRMIIVGHVKDGLELAQEFKLPRVLHQFIANHHGTTLMEYFYHEAVKNEEAQEGRSVLEVDFRYPGPKPGTKEAAIIMLADAVESAARAMQDPAPNRIENVVREVGLKRLQDGQFDDCDLTMRELSLIEDSLIKSLCGMYHGRIDYPKRPREQK